MAEVIHLRCRLRLPSNPRNLPIRIPRIPSSSHNAPRLRPARGLPLSLKAPVSFPEMPPKPISSFHEKALFLDSLGIDLLAAAAAHPPAAAAPLAGVRATVDLLRSLGLTNPDLRRVAGMCPEVLSSPPASVLSVITFLLREAGVAGTDLPRVIHRRPRLLVSDVSTRLRPTLYFLQAIGITSVARHTPLLSCSVEDKLLPRLEFLHRAGFSSRDSRAMARRFPQIFCYSIEGNLEPKFEFFVGEMRREMLELREFPQYFSFSLQNRIRPRHRECEEKGVILPLPAMLRRSDEQFRLRMEDEGEPWHNVNVAPFQSGCRAQVMETACSLGEDISRGEEKLKIPVAKQMKMRIMD